MKTHELGKGVSRRVVWPVVWYACFSVICLFGLSSCITTGGSKAPAYTAAALKDPEVVQMKAQFQKKVNELEQLMEKATADMQYRELELIDWDNGKKRRTQANLYGWDENVEKCYKELSALRDQALRLINKKKAEYRKKSLQATMQPSCFPADMKVALADGRTESIARIKKGDLLLTYNEETGTLTKSPVVGTLAAVENHYYLFNGRIKVTAMHRIFTDKGWKRAQDIDRGDKIRMADGRFQEIVARDFVPGDLAVYNLEVLQNHNFFVSPDGNNAYLVHNYGGGK
jgi:hypothetical protein